MYEKAAAEAERALAQAYRPGPLPTSCSADQGGEPYPYSRGFRSVYMPGDNVGREVELQQLGRHRQGLGIDYDHHRPSSSVASRSPGPSPGARPPPSSPAPSCAPARSSEQLRSGFTLAEMADHTASLAAAAGEPHHGAMVQRMDPSRWAPSRASSVYVVEDDSPDDDFDDEEDDEADDTNSLQVVGTKHRKRPGKKKRASQRCRQALADAQQQGLGRGSQAASAVGTLAMLPPPPPCPSDAWVGPRSSASGSGEGKPGSCIPPPPPSWSGGGSARVLDYCKGELIETKHEGADPDRTTVIPAHRPCSPPVPHGGARPTVVLKTSAAVEALSSRARDLLAAENGPSANDGSRHGSRRTHPAPGRPDGMEARPLPPRPAPRRCTASATRSTRRCRAPSRSSFATIRTGSHGSPCTGLVGRGWRMQSERRTRRSGCQGRWWRTTWRSSCTAGTLGVRPIASRSARYRARATPWATPALKSGPSTRDRMEKAVSLSVCNGSAMSFRPLGGTLLALLIPCQFELVSCNISAQRSPHMVWGRGLIRPALADVVGTRHRVTTEGSNQHLTHHLNPW